LGPIGAGERGGEADPIEEQDSIHYERLPQDRSKNVIAPIQMTKKSEN